MARTLVTNESDGTFTFPPPYSGVLGSNESAVLEGAPETIIANLGGAAAVGRSLRFESVNGSEPLTAHAALPSASLATTAAPGYMSSSDKTRISDVGRLFAFSPGAKGDAAVHAAVAATAPKVFVGPFVDPDVPRNLRVVFGATWDGGAVTVSGTDQFGIFLTEVFAVPALPGETVGTKIFQTVTGASKASIGLSADAASIGTGDKIGVPADLRSAFAVLLVDDVPEAVTVDNVVEAFTPTTAPDGLKYFKLLANV